MSFATAGSHRPPARIYYGYAIVAAGFVVQGTVMGAFFTYGVFFDALYAEFGWSRAVLSGAASTANLVMGAGAFLFGALTDRLGPRRIITVAGFAIAAGYLFMSRIQLPWQLYATYALLVGIAFAAHDVVTLSTVARWFHNRRGRMSGLVKVGTGVGQVIGPPAAALLIAGFGWRSAYLWIAAVAGPLVLLAGQFMRRSPDSGDSRGPAAPAAPDSEQDDPGEPTPDQDASQAAPAYSAHAHPEDSSRARELMRRPAFRLMGLAQLSLFFSVFTVIVHVVPYATDLGISREIASGVLSVIGGLSIAGRLAVGALADRIGARRSMLLCAGILASALAFLQFAGSVYTLYLFAVIYGFAHGGVFTGMSPMVADYFGLRVHGLLYGAIVFVGTVAAALGPPIAGGAFDLLGTYRPVFVLLVVLALVAVIALLRLRKHAPAHR